VKVKLVVKASDLEKQELELEVQLGETRRLLSASRLAIHLDSIHRLLREGRYTEALAAFEENSLKNLMILHGHTGACL